MSSACEEVGEQSPTFASFPMIPVCNTVEEIIFANVRSSRQRDLVWFDAENDEHDRHVAIVGGGPSVRDMLDEIRWRKSIGQDVWVLNNAAVALEDIEIDAQVICDARPQNAAFVTDAKEYLIASQCDPAVFDALEGRNVTLWHCNVAGMADLLDDEKARVTYLIGGGTTVGMNALQLAISRGYRMIHLYGFDSSYRDGEHHAYRQAINDSESRSEVMYGGKTYVCAPWMVGQAQEFMSLAPTYQASGVTITVHGSGLLPDVAKPSVRKIDYATVVYDLGVHPWSWDFAVWLIKAEMMRRAHGHGDHLSVYLKPGPDRGFRHDSVVNVPLEYRQRFRDQTLRPLLSMVGAVELQDEPKNGTQYNYIPREIIQAHRDGMEVPRFVASADDLATVDQWLEDHGIYRAPIVITLREASHWPTRNSNIEAWLAFARIQSDPVIIVRDTEKADEPIDGLLTCPRASRDVRFRAALYHHARCNLSISTGPTSGLCVYGERPYLIFGQLTDQSAAHYYPGTATWWRSYGGLSVGEQYPWASPKQRLTWTSDTLENIETAWAAFQN